MLFLMVFSFRVRRLPLLRPSSLVTLLTTAATTSAATVAINFLPLVFSNHEMQFACRFRFNFVLSFSTNGERLNINKTFNISSAGTRTRAQHVFGIRCSRKTFVAGKTIARIIWSAASHERIEYYFNNIRIRRLVKPSALPLLGSGTSPNESLHAEMNSWFRNQPETFSSTLDLQLRVCSSGKRLTHNSAMYRPTLRQQAQSTVLHSVVVCLRIDQDDWEKHCGDAEFHPHTLRGVQDAQRRIQNHVFKKPVVFKRPAVQKRPSGAIKRTPFNLKREHPGCSKEVARAKRN